ncbi:LytR C-terminal domain-containing protein [Streptomyces montanisoli]|uniref:LytR C-terminal domain-containing protein n=1 Tax=Streptomyces montanisoli TaxID=2798581 RepID=A0A940RTM0_9ACTN|nr:LytR C-terminal domain-containing protein [Streptomyces montanisoli]MBP0457027.1 LytR C-terminal domain-containing protein [Streptomyces montanisoli]
MSMLTPPGLGGKYRITGDKYPRMRRPRRRGRVVFAVVTAVVVLGLVGWGTQQLIHVFSGDASKAIAAKKPDCTRPAAAAKTLPKPAQITVNVYNATTRSGLAQRTADELKKRGFVVGKVGNASAQYDKKVAGAAVLLGAPSAANGTFTVLGTQVKGASPKTDTRTGKDVDFIIGTGFTALTAQKVADTELASLSKPPAKPGCPSAGTRAAKAGAKARTGPASHG